VLAGGCIFGNTATMNSRLVVAGIIGAVVFVIVGFMVYATGWGDRAVTFPYWVQRPFRFGVWIWALIGAGVGVGLLWVSRRD
jgi:hypothetical protein